MKKLFFTALVAVVAVGSALSVNAITVYRSNGNPIDCSSGDITCAAAFPGETLYKTDPTAGPAQEVDSEVYQLGYND